MEENIFDRINSVCTENNKLYGKAIFNETGELILESSTGNQISIPSNPGGYIISTGCGTGKTMAAKHLIAQKYNEGIIYCVDTRVEAVKMYKWIVEVLPSVVNDFTKEDVLLYISDCQDSTFEDRVFDRTYDQYPYFLTQKYENARQNPSNFSKYRVIITTHVSFFTWRINYLIDVNATDCFDGDWEKLMSLNSVRRWIIFDETPSFIKPIWKGEEKDFGILGYILDNCKLSTGQYNYNAFEGEIRRLRNYLSFSTTNNNNNKDVEETNKYNYIYDLKSAKGKVSRNLFPYLHDKRELLTNGEKKLEKNKSILLYPFNLIQKGMKSKVLILEGAGEFLFNSCIYDNRYFTFCSSYDPSTSKNGIKGGHYTNTTCEFREFSMEGINRNTDLSSLLITNEGYTRLLNVATNIASCINNVWNSSGRKTLVFVYIDWKDKSEESTHSITFDELLANQLIINQSMYHITYFGANDTKSTNVYRDYGGIVFVGPWGKGQQIIKDAYGGVNDSYYREWYFIQAITRTCIRNHSTPNNHLYLYFSDEFKKDKSSKDLYNNIYNYLNYGTVPKISPISISSDMFYRKQLIIDDLSRIQEINKSARDKVEKFIDNYPSIINEMIEIMLGHKNFIKISLPLKDVGNVIGISKKNITDKSRYNSFIEALSKFGIYINLTT